MQAFDRSFRRFFPGIGMIFLFEVIITQGVANFGPKRGQG